MGELALSTNKIWEELREPLKRFIARRVKNEHDTEDILQNIFCKIHNSIDNLKDDSKLHAWAYRITRNAITDYYHHRKVMVELLELPEDLEIYEPAAGIDNTVNEIASCLKAMMNHLPEKYRQAITLTEFTGLTQKELGEKLGLSLSGAKSRVQRAREKLKAMLLECCNLEFDRLGNILDYRHKENTCPYCAENQSGSNNCASFLPDLRL